MHVLAMRRADATTPRSTLPWGTTLKVSGGLVSYCRSERGAIPSCHRGVRQPKLLEGEGGRRVGELVEFAF
jgi:hypothetical protein